MPRGLQASSISFMSLEELRRQVEQPGDPGILDVREREAHVGLGQGKACAHSHGDPEGVEEQAPS